MKKMIFIMFAALFLVMSNSVETYAATKYKVQRGDSLYTIAKDHNVSVQQLKKWNNLTTSTIHPNQSLKVKPPKKGTVKKSKQPSRSTDDKVVKEFTVTASAYTAKCNGCSGITSTGIDLKKNPDVKVIAVDPNVIPLGTKVYVEGYGYAIAADTGSSIKGNKIDVFFPTTSEAYQWGKKSVKVKIMK